MSLSTSTRLTSSRSARPTGSASRLLGWVLLPVGASLVTVAAALDMLGLQALAIIILMVSTASLAASLKDDDVVRPRREP